MMHVALLILAALLSVVLVEGGVVAWLSLAGAGVDLTGNFFLLALAPVVLLVTLVIGLVFGRIFIASPKVHGVIYMLAWLILHGTVLKVMSNPVMDIAWYLETIVVVAGPVLMLLYFTRWRTASIPAP